MNPIGRRYQSLDEPVPGYRLTDLTDAGPWGMEHWKATGPDGREVAVTILPIRKDVTAEVLEWFHLLPRFKRVTHPHLLSLPDLWLKTEDGRVLAELPPVASAASGAMPAGQDPMEVIEIDLWNLRFRTVRDRLRECRSQTQRGIPWRELLRYLVPVAQALDYLHQPVHDLGGGPLPIVHGGVSPQDLVLVGDTVKLANWANLAKSNVFEVHRRLTPSATIRTIAYSAPERIAGAPVAASDQYSLAILYTAFRTAALPYRKGTSPSDMLQLIRTGELDLSRLSVPEQRVIRKATSLDAEKRWPTCSYLMQALQVAHDAV